MLLELLKLFFEISPLQYLYMFLGLAGVLIIVVRQKMSIEDEIRNFSNHQFRSKHPELKEKQSYRTRLHLLHVTISILMTLVTITGVFRYTIGDTVGQRMIQKFEDSRQWNDKPIRQLFVTYGRFKDAGTITIKYDLIIHLPKYTQLEDLKSIYRNPDRLLNNYIKPYINLISTATCASYSTNDASVNRDKFVNFIRNQVGNGVHPSLGISTADIGRPPKSYGINIVVETIEYTFDDTIRKLQLFKRRTELPPMEEWVEKARAASKLKGKK